MNAQGHDSAASPPISWESVLTSLEEAVIVIDRDGRISFLNQAAETLTGIPVRQLMQRPYASVFHDNGWLLEMVGKSRSLQPGSLRGEGDFVTDRRHQLPVSLVVSPLHDRSGNCLGTVLLMRDLSVRRQMEEDLRRSDRLALLGTLAAGLAHELKNPLSGIKGASQLLRRELAGEPSLVEYTDIVVREVDRVNHLLEQLLDLSRPPRLHLGSHNIHELIDQVLLLEGQTASAGTIRVRRNFDPSLPPIRGDRAQLTQVFLNLIKNAFQAMNGDGRLVLATRSETDFHRRESEGDRGKFIRVDVEDNGPGIRGEDLPHIFSPFFTTKRNGTGLGLATCARIIQDHGGLIRVESRAGEGAIFKVSLPVAD